jgi:hypothetical protein
MPYSLHADEARTLIELVYTGEIKASTRVCAMEDGDALLFARGYRRVLVDLREAVPAPKSDGDASFPSRMAHRPPRMSSSRLAYVTRPRSPFDLLAGNLAVIRHAAVGYFHRREDAVEWLLLDPDV